MTARQKGFTLLELLVAMGIFGISLTGFAGALLMTVRGNRLSQETSDAIGLGQNLLESRPTAPGSDTALNGAMSFSRTWTVDNNSPPTTPPNQARTVTITVSWLDGPTRSVTLQSILRN